LHSVPHAAARISGKRVYLVADERRAFGAAAGRAERLVRTFCAVLLDSGWRISEALARPNFRARGFP
jgi:hypothetical protein